MKNILLAITSAVTIIAILERAGVVDWIDKDQSYQIADYCDNTNRNLPNGKDGGGTGIDSVEAGNLMKMTRERMSSQGTKLRHEYFLSKSALDLLFEDKYATGIFIAPYDESPDSMNIIVGKAHCNHTIIDQSKKFAFVIKTFCPADCEME